MLPNIIQKFDYLDFERFSKADYVHEADIPLSSLYATDICTVKSGKVCKLFL